MVWLRALGLPLPIAASSSLENTRDKGKIELYMCACQPVALMVKGECVLDFCLKRDSYDSGHSKTNEVFSALIDG